eukprot:889687_1
MSTEAPPAYSIQAECELNVQIPSNPSQSIPTVNDQNLDPHGNSAIEHTTHEDSLYKFMAMTNAETSVAKTFMQAAKWDMSSAINHFFECGGDTSKLSPPKRKAPPPEHGRKCVRVAFVGFSAFVMIIIGLSVNRVTSGTLSGTDITLHCGWSGYTAICKGLHCNSDAIVMMKASYYQVCEWEQGNRRQFDDRTKTSWCDTKPVASSSLVFMWCSAIFALFGVCCINVENERHQGYSCPRVMFILSMLCGIIGMFVWLYIRNCSGHSDGDRLFFSWSVVCIFVAEVLAGVAAAKVAPGRVIIG